MNKSCGELWRDPQFLLKLIVLIIGVLLNVFVLESAYRYYNDVLSIGYHYSFLSLMLALVLAYVWFESTKVTDCSLLFVAAIKLLVTTFTFNFTHEPHYVQTEDGPIADARTHHFSDLSQEHRFYILLVFNIISVIMICVDIYLRMKG